MTGSIPEQATEFSRLRVLRLSQNSITGSIPANFSKFTAMQVFDVTRNSITGTVGAGKGFGVDGGEQLAFRSSLLAAHTQCHHRESVGHGYVVGGVRIGLLVEVLMV